MEATSKSLFVATEPPRLAISLPCAVFTTNGLIVHEAKRRDAAISSIFFPAWFKQDAASAFSSSMLNFPSFRTRLAIAATRLDVTPVFGIVDFPIPLLWRIWLFWQDSCCASLPTTRIKLLLQRLIRYPIAELLLLFEERENRLIDLDGAFQ